MIILRIIKPIEGKLQSKNYYGTEKPANEKQPFKSHKFRIAQLVLSMLKYALNINM